MPNLDNSQQETPDVSNDQEVRTDADSQELPDQETQAAEENSTADNDSHVEDYDWRKEIKRLRDENADRRVKLREAEQKSEKLNERLEQLIAGLGKLTGTSADEETNPEVLLEQANARAEKSDQAYRELLASSALKDAIVKSGADLELAVPFIQSKEQFKQLDPTDEEFASQVEAFVLEVVEKTPKLRAGAGMPPSSGNKPARTPSNGKTYTVADIKRLASEGKFAEINAAHERGLIQF